jgi:4-hydroxythreonine-4-phosphate dehydrogenase
MFSSGKITIAISTGDPAGIGPEVTVKALADPEIRSLANWIVVGEYSILAEAARGIALEPDAVVTDDPEIPPRVACLVWSPGAIDRDALKIGVVSQEAGAASLEYVRLATQACLNGAAQAIVTGPVSKEAISLTGRHFTGHTEYIAELAGAPSSRMLLVNDSLRVVHVTTHCSLADAIQADEERVFETIVLGHQALERLGYAAPRIAVCGLNPHAGENGLFGDQERRVIAPAIERAKRLRIDCVGPLPADTLVLHAVRGKYDLVVAMYHDQGHVPMKLLDFENTVNITLGLPIIRTSVDHGTAFDIAGQNRANADHMKIAIRLAVRLCAAKNKASIPAASVE